MNKLLFIVLIIGSLSGLGQETDSFRKPDKLGISFEAGYFNILPGKRFVTTTGGYHVEMVVRYSVAPKVLLGAGLLWGASPDIDAPEFDVFAPRDHPIWFESSQYFLELRYFIQKEKSSILSPYIGGRLGWTTEFAEYSGPIVNRSGLLISGNGGVSIQITKRVSLDTSFIFSLVQLGDATVFDEKVPDTSVTGSFFGIRGGVDFWF